MQIIDSSRSVGPKGLLSTHYAVSGALLPVDFKLYAPKAKNVYLIGEMSNWLQDKIPMVFEEDGFWRIRLNLRHGQWLYKFEVDGQWRSDPNNPLVAEDGMGVGEWHSYCFVGRGYWSENPNKPQGRVLELNIPSKRLGSEIPCTVYLPPDAYPTSTYPLLTLLHGHQMLANQWPKNGRLAQYMDNLLTKNMIQPFAVLMPAGHHHVDMPRYGQALVDDIFPWLSQHFPITQNTAQRGIAGMSIRRHGPLALALNNPLAFGWVAPINENFNDETIVRASTLADYPFQLKLYCTLEGCSYPRYQEFVQKAQRPINYMRLSGHPTWRHWNGITRELLMSANAFFYDSHSEEAS